MKLKISFFLLSIFLTQITLAQEPAFLQGTINNTKSEPLVGAVVFWKNTLRSTTTDSLGHFALARALNEEVLIVQLLGYQSDTLLLNPENLLLKIVLLPDKGTLSLVEVSTSGKHIENENTQLVDRINKAELSRSACCNLSESFENNASVDVSYADAVTGIKQIRLLGFDGAYSFISLENLPALRGLASSYGLYFIPGTWVQSIDLIKGTGSIISGYESMTGQINIDLIPPDKREYLLNVYLNHMGRSELNIHLANKINKVWSTAVLGHVSVMPSKIDQNRDNFLDLPQSRQFNVLNRWKRETKSTVTQWSVQALHDNRKGGQLTPTSPPEGIYATSMDIGRLEGFFKHAHLFTPYRSLGIMLKGVYHDQQGYLGPRNYNGLEKLVYANLLYQDIIGSTKHIYKVGLSYVWNDFQEKFQDSTFQRSEFVPGLYGAYTFTPSEKFSVVAGSRLDFHNLFGGFVTPRLHARYEFNPHHILRLSAGKGFRVANPIVESLNYLVSSRQVRVIEKISPEISWNYGLGFQKKVHIFEKQADILIDYYRIDFENQLIVDLDRAADQIQYYNLRGKSFSNNFQTELHYEILKGWQLKAAYRFQEVKTTTADRLQDRLFTSRHKWLLSSSYKTKFEKWQFDLTARRTGRQRLPVPPTNEPLLESWAPAFWTINAQVTKRLRRDWEPYLGAENLGNFTQTDPIVNTQDPFSQNFDASRIWGPLIGTMVYTGIRWNF